MNFTSADGETRVPITQRISDLWEVDSSLSALYRKVLGESPPSAPTVRTILLNLVSFSHSREDADEAEAVVAQISGSHPCRAVVIDALPPREGEPESSVSVICGITDRGDRRLCGDVIHLHLHEEPETAVGAVMPLLVSDVPVFLWAPGDLPTNYPQFDVLADVADSVIVDSRRFADLRSGLEMCAGLVRPAPARRTIRDLAWVSTHWWRELTAQHFDPPAARTYARLVSDVSVKYAPDERQTPVPAEPMLFASWLISRLGLAVDRVTSDGTGGVSIAARQGENPVEVAVSPDDSGSGPGQLVSALIRCNTGKSAAAGGTAELATFLTRGISPTEVAISEECKGLCFTPRVVDTGPRSTSVLLSEALDLPWRYKVFEEAFETAREILTLLDAGQSRQSTERQGEGRNET